MNEKHSKLRLQARINCKSQQMPDPGVKFEIIAGGV